MKVPASAVLEAILRLLEEGLIQNANFIRLNDPEGARRYLEPHVHRVLAELAGEPEASQGSPVPAQEVRGFAP
ncbi:hypothetical protein GN073_09470 [Helicobacter pylori]|uniref:hypothetical protein n=1 Tax=Calidithermus timidus TaxID=307124 RepID=UPI00038040C6|nr:hypothetical protein [Calidithermus timidus]MWR36498.1 hypothetical protein [Helicobacter pylori]